MGLYEYWFQDAITWVRISEMSDFHIMNCLNMIEGFHQQWRDVTIEDLSCNEIKEKDLVGEKAWFVIHGIAYKNAFSDELKKRAAIELRKDL